MKIFKRLEFCCIILRAGMLCTSDKPYLVSVGLKGFCQLFMWGDNAALLFFETGVLCSAAG